MKYDNVKGNFELQIYICDIYEHICMSHIYIHIYVKC